MLDRKFVVENAQLVEENCRRRGSQADVRQFVALEAQRKAKQTEVDELNRRANEVSKSIGQAKSPEEREARKAEGRSLRDATTAAQAELEQIATQGEAILRMMPNLTHPAAPVGADDGANLEL